MLLRVSEAPEFMPMNKEGRKKKNNKTTKKKNQYLWVGKSEKQAQKMSMTAQKTEPHH